MIGNPRSDQELIIFVLEQIEVIEGYLQDIEAYEFYNNSMLRDACLTRLLAIGEYSKRVSDEIKDKYPDVEWRIIAQARNFYAHGYGAMEWTRVWETLHVEVPGLKKEFQTILNDL